jgi:hypothetical protein
MLASSRLIRSRVRHTELRSTAAPISPALSEQLFGRGRIACGTGAMRFDPLCGEGAGNAIREAFLAAGAVRAALAGTVAQDLLAQHYSARLTQGMLRHLQTCLHFYSTGGVTSFWSSQAALLRVGMTQLEGRLREMPPPTLRLVDRDLIAPEAQ